MSPHDLSQAHILVVDDDPVIQTLIKRMLTRTGKYTVDTADTGEQALAKIRSNPPDLITLDYMMPGLSGLDVLEQLRQERQGKLWIPVIMISAALDSEEVALHSITKSMVVDTLPKPFRPEELLTLVEKRLDDR